MTYESTCPRCGAMLTSGGCLSCGYPNGNLRDKIAADTALALKSSGDKPLGFVRYELLAEAWDSISKLGRELFDARTCIEELEAEIVNHESWLTTQQAATYAAEAERDEARRELAEAEETICYLTVGSDLMRYHERYRPFIARAHGRPAATEKDPFRFDMLDACAFVARSPRGSRTNPVVMDVPLTPGGDGIDPVRVHSSVPWEVHGFHIKTLCAYDFAGEVVRLTGELERERLRACLALDDELLRAIFAIRTWESFTHVGFLKQRRDAARAALGDKP